MAIPFLELKELISKGKIVHQSVCAVERQFFNDDNKDFSSYYEHKEFGFRIPYLSTYKDDIIRIVTNELPDYDMIIWRVDPEIIFYKYMKPLKLDFEFWYEEGTRIPEADIEELYGKLTKEEKPDFLIFYTRFSLGKNNKQVDLNFHSVKAA